MIELYSLGTSSKGNSFLFKLNDSLILLDIGFNPNKLKSKLNYLGYNIDDINYVFITHKHHDHYDKNTLKYFAENKVFTCNSADICSKLFVHNVYTFDGFKVCPIRLSHDEECTGYIFSCNEEKIVFISDTGYFKADYYPLVSNPEYLFIEANYDPNMLNSSSRPDRLIRRINSKNGHLSNEESFIVASKIVGSKTKKIGLIHLSQDCNNPEIVRKTFEKIETGNTKIVICAPDDVIKITD